MQKLGVPYISALPGDCGIASTEMLVKFYEGRLGRTWPEYRTVENYIPSVGWKHNSLKNIANSSTNLRFKTFRNKAHLFVLNKLSKGIPLVVSVLVPEKSDLSQKIAYQKIWESAPEGRHTVVCVGYTTNSIIVHDSRDMGIYKENLEIPLSTFIRIFNGSGVFN